MSTRVFSGEGVDPSRYDDTRPDAPKWGVNARAIEASDWRLLAGQTAAEVTHPAKGISRLTLRTVIESPSVLVELHYELYDGYPVVRKWAVVRNRGAEWLRLDRMTIDDIQLMTLTRKSLAAAMFGVQPSVMAFEGPGGRFGLIAASEVPSALRNISDSGAMGYTRGLFEWVLGPGEEFASEPVFYYAYSGEVRPVASSVSTPLDRTLEGRHTWSFVQASGWASPPTTAPMHGTAVDDVGLLLRQDRRQADPANWRRSPRAPASPRCCSTMAGRRAGWVRKMDTVKFPDFAATSDFVRAQGLKLGLWVSCYRDAGCARSGGYARR